MEIITTAPTAGLQAHKGGIHTATSFPMLRALNGPTLNEACVMSDTIIYIFYGYGLLPLATFDKSSSGPDIATTHTSCLP